jgi:hypothetical protein
MRLKMIQVKSGIEHRQSHIDVILKRDLPELFMHVKKIKMLTCENTSRSRRCRLE